MTSPDLTPPPAPTLVGAAITGIETVNGVDRRNVQVTWTDNTTAADEFNTCFRFRTADGGPDTTQCLYGSEYGAAGTGQRSGTVICGMAATEVSAYTTRYVDLSEAQDGSRMYALSSEFSNTVPLEGAPTPADSGKPGKGKGQGGKNQ